MASRMILGLFLVSGCAPSLAGDWNLTQRSSHGTTEDYPITLDEQGLTDVISIDMHIDSDLGGALNATVVETPDDGSAAATTTTVSQDLTIEKQSGGKYAVNAAKSGDVDAVAFQCLVNTDGILLCADDTTTLFLFAPG